MTRLRLVLITLALFLAGFVGFVWSAGPAPSDEQIVIPAKASFSKGRFLAYAQPWGGQAMVWTRWWAPYADAMAIHIADFPGKTTFNWRWPPLMPPNGPGVWGYDHIGYGNYDGGEPEVSVPAKRVRDVRSLKQSFAWRMEAPLGDGNVLTEFYLRSDPREIDSKLLEIGWFLHTPPGTKRWIERSTPVGIWIDGEKRRWKVVRDDKFVMFMPVDGRDVASGSLDMLPALHWLQEKGLVRGDEWLTGYAIGVEPTRGVGRLHLDRWQPTFD